MSHDKVYLFDDSKCKKEGLTKVQIESMRNNTESKFIRAYKSLSELGATATTRLDAIVNAMATPSIAYYTVTVTDDSVYPVGTNRVMISKYTDGNFEINVDNNGIKYNKDSFTNSYGSYDKSFNQQAKILQVLTGSMTLLPYSSTFRTIGADTSLDLSKVIPVFNFNNMSSFQSPPNVQVNMAINNDIMGGTSLLLACARNNENYQLTFNYTVLLLGV